MWYIDRTILYMWHKHIHTQSDHAEFYECLPFVTIYFVMFTHKISVNFVCGKSVDEVEALNK